jgi:drug/metabolite transporter (DMT)-like permease
MTDIPAGPVRWAIPALLLGNLCLVFGPVFVRMADVGPVSSGFWRMALAVVPLFLIARLASQPAERPTGNTLWLFFVSGLFFAADIATWHLGIFQTKLANAALLANSSSFLLPLWGFLIARSWPNRGQGMALALALLGAIILMGRSYEMSRGNLVGDVLCFLAGAFYTGYLIIMTRLRASIAEWPALAWSSLMTVAPMLIVAALLGETIIPTDWTPVIALAFFSQILGQGLMIYALGSVSPLLFGLLLLLQPVISAILGWLWYGEQLATLDYFGAILIGLALILVRRS